MLKFVFCLVFTFFCHVSGATQLCADVVSQTPITIWRNESDAMFRSQLLGDPKLRQQELYFYWHMAYPFRIKKIDDSNYSVGFSNKRMRIYRNNSDIDSNQPLEAINTLFAKQDTPNVRMLREFLKSYKNRVSEPIIETIRELESTIESLARGRQSFGYIGAKPLSDGGEVIGTFRVFNGVPAQSETSALLPMEHSFIHDKVQTKTALKLQALRERNLHALIFEIGKFSLFGNPVSVSRARNMFELFLLKNYVDSLPKHSLFYAHAVTEAHVKLYIRNYGFRLIEEVSIPNQKEKEYILEATGKELRHALSKTHKLPSMGVNLHYTEQ
jgi:hypothetical protein